MMNRQAAESDPEGDFLPKQPKVTEQGFEPCSDREDNSDGAPDSGASPRMNEMHTAIKEVTSDWVACTARGKSNALSHLHVRQKFATADSILSRLSQCDYQPSPTDWINVKTIGEIVNFTVNRGDYSTDSPYEEFPDQITPVHRDALLSHVNNVSKALTAWVSENKTISMANVDVVSAARLFIEEVLLFLKLQPVAQQKAVEGLFVSFCKIAGLRFRCGGYRRPREMQIYDVSVSSQTDLRAHSYRLQSWEDEIDQKMNENKTSLKYFPDLPVLAVAVVKSLERQLPGCDCNETSNAANKGKAKDAEKNLKKNQAFEQVKGVLGQLIGGMLAEIYSEETLSPTECLGFAVQGTKVQLVVLKMNEELLQFLANPDNAKNHDNYDDEEGEVFVSEAFDILNYTHRQSLLSLMCRVSTLKKKEASQPY